MISYILRIVSIFYIKFIFFFVFLFLNFLYGEESVGCYEATVAPLGFGMSTESDYLTRQEAAYIKVCLSTADKIFQEPGFKGRIKIGRRVLISKTKLDEYLKIRNQKYHGLNNSRNSRKINCLNYY